MPGLAQGLGLRGLGGEGLTPRTASPGLCHVVYRSLEHVAPVISHLLVTAAVMGLKQRQAVLLDKGLRLLT